MRRFTLGLWGTANATVSGGALLDASLDPARCPFQLCPGAAVGLMAGTTASFYIIGAESEARFLNDFVVGGVGVNAGGGVLGGITRAAIEIRGGGILRTESVHIGGWASPGGNGNEKSFSALVVTGQDSRWMVTGSSLFDAIVSSGTHPKGEATWMVADGAKLIIQAPIGSERESHLRLAHGGGRSSMLVNDLGSELQVSGHIASINVGENGGTAELSIRNGAQVTINGVADSYINIGMPGSEGTVFVSGGTITGMRRLNVGLGGGKGQLLVSDKGVIKVGSVRVQ